ncbi:MAG: hypothetical protein IJ443_00120 [Firmicutes bacterium]|nr:hypothetical protein [Bacillota bacterium]
MFTRKAKRNYRIVIFSAVIVCLCILIVALVWPETPVETTQADAGINPSYNSPGAEEDILMGNPDDADGEKPEVGEDFLPGSGMSPGTEDGQDGYTENNGGPTANHGETGGTGENQAEKEENNMNQSEQSYYLVKRAGEQIVVYFCDSNGNMVQLETTDIIYEMLGPEDQKLFDQGIQAARQEELSILLQDFES